MNQQFIYSIACTDLLYVLISFDISAMPVVWLDQEATEHQLTLQSAIYVGKLACSKHQAFKRWRGAPMQNRLLKLQAWRLRDLIWQSTLIILPSTKETSLKYSVFGRNINIHLSVDDYDCRLAWNVSSKGLHSTVSQNSNVCWNNGWTFLWLIETWMYYWGHGLWMFWSTLKYIPQVLTPHSEAVLRTAPCLISLCLGATLHLFQISSANILQIHHLHVTVPH